LFIEIYSIEKAAFPVALGVLYSLSHPSPLPRVTWSMQLVESQAIPATIG